jgi:hypothetical protein
MLLPEREGGFKAADISQDQRALSLFFRTRCGRSSRISAGQTKSVAEQIDGKTAKTAKAGRKGSAGD